MAAPALVGPGVRELRPGYASEFDAVTEEQWCRILDRFADANIYQTWSYGAVRCGPRNMSHLVLRRDGEIVAAAQARVVRLPFLRAGVAYVRWGPLCRRDGGADRETFRQAIRALRNEYACRRGLLVRVYPALFDDDARDCVQVLEDEGYQQARDEKRSRTLLLDVSGPLEGVRRGLRPHWKRYLKVAEKSGLEVVDGSDDRGFETFVRIYKEMVARKGFSEPNDINEFRRMQQQLPDRLRMKVLLCRWGEDVCAGLVCSALGDTGVYLFGATSDAGLTRRGSYLLHWKAIEWLREKGIRTYDLNGINPAENPGTYKFKADLCGNNGRDVSFLGRFDSCTSVLSHAAVASAEKLRMSIRSVSTRVLDRGTGAPAGGPDADGDGPAALGPRPETGVESRDGAGPARRVAGEDRGIGGLLIVNADDWGRDRPTTDRTLECVEHGPVTSVSGMVFMDDSERAASLARERGIEAALHLNFTTPFSARDCPARLRERQQQLARYLLRHRFAQVVFHPGLAAAFEYVVTAQLEEFRRLYGVDPERLDGHHHMHLCANVLLHRLLPPGTIVRRSFSFDRGEKSMWNRLYRGFVNGQLRRRHRLVDFFFSLAPVEGADRLDRILSLARTSVVEVETHPAETAEYRFLVGGELVRRARDVRIAPASALSSFQPSTAENRR